MSRNASATNPCPGLFSRFTSLAADRKLGSFSCPIPRSFVLSSNMPMINTTSKLASFWRFSTGASRVNESMRRLHVSTPGRFDPGDGYGCHAHAKSEHEGPWSYPIRGASSAGMTCAAHHALDNASMPPRDRHGRLGLIGKTGSSITTSPRFAFTGH